MLTPPLIAIYLCISKQKNIPIINPRYMYFSLFMDTSTEHYQYNFIVKMQ